MTKTKLAELVREYLYHQVVSTEALRNYAEARENLQKVVVDHFRSRGKYKGDLVVDDAGKVALVHYEQSEAGFNLVDVMLIDGLLD